MESAAAQVQEKWADKLRLFISADVPPHEIGKGEYPPFPDVFQVKDLPKTETEKAAIAEVIDAVADLCKAVCGERVLPFSPERVHIMEEREFQEKVGHGKAAAKTWMGHVYIENKWPLPVFQALLAHEMLHAVSYLWIDMHHYAGPTMNGMRVPNVFLRHSGMTFNDPSYGTLLPHFHGLNECVTETAAFVVRQTIAKRSKLLDDAQKKALATFVSSPPLVLLMNELMTIASRPEEDSVAVWKVLLSDYLHGTSAFLQLLEPRLPGATERLRRTGARPDELLPAALDLGLTAVAEQIRPYVA